LPYLVGLERAELLACIEEPVAEADPRKDEEAELTEAAIKVAMERLMGFSQALSLAIVIERIGVFVWLGAIRTEKHQTRYLAPGLIVVRILFNVPRYVRAL
jgi:hypothetical protein